MGLQYKRPQRFRNHSLTLLLLLLFYHSRLFHSFSTESMAIGSKKGDPKVKPTDHPQAKLTDQPKKKAIFSLSLREQKILKPELSRRKLREISRKFAQTIFSPRTFAHILRENSEPSKNFQFKFLFCLICGFTSHSTTIVMSRRSVNLTTLFMDRLSKR